jgi:hypothetical protein
MDKVQKHNSFNTHTSSSESYKNYLYIFLVSQLNFRFFGSSYIIVLMKSQRSDSLLITALVVSFNSSISFITVFPLVCFYGVF